MKKERKCKVPSGFIQIMMEIVLKWNLFEFHEATYIQQVGVAMGIHPAPNYADIFMAINIDTKILDFIEQIKIESTKEKPIMLLLLKGFLDDLFFIFQGSTKQIHNLFIINKIHCSIQFTMKHTTNEMELKEDKCYCAAKKSISYFDTSCSIQNAKI